MTTPTTTQSPAELFTSIASQLDQMRVTLRDLREQEKLPPSDGLLLLEYSLGQARTKALLAAQIAMVPEKTMSAGGENQQ